MPPKQIPDNIAWIRPLKKCWIQVPENLNNEHLFVKGEVISITGNKVEVKYEEEKICEEFPKEVNKNYNFNK